MEKTVISAPAAGFIMLKRGFPIEKRAEELFSVRSKPLIRGRLREETQKVADTVFGILTENVTIKGKEEKEFKKLAISFSRLIASYCSDSETGKPIIEISPNMRNVLLCFSEMLQEETKLAVEERLPRPFFSLSKFSVYEIADVKYKLKEHPDLIVRKNARTILDIAIAHSNLILAEELAKEAKPTRDKLAKEYAGNEVVMNYLGTIMSAALSKGNLNLAEKLAKEAKSTRDRLAKEYAGNEVVMNYLGMIMTVALSCGDLSLAEKLAKEISMSGSLAALRR